jgi:hypothetical protein
MIAGGTPVIVGLHYGLMMAKTSIVSSTVSVGANPDGRSAPKKSDAEPWKRTPEQCVVDSHVKDVAPPGNGRPFQGLEAGGSIA